MHPPLDSVPVACVDLEFTGLDPTADHVVEVAVVRAVGDVVESAQSWLVRPAVPMGADARRLTGLDDDALADAPLLAEITPEICRLLDGAILVGHRPELDHAHLSAAVEASGGPALALPAFDTMRMARHLLAMRSHALSIVCGALGVVQHGAHRALPDAQATFAVFRNMCRLLNPDGRLSVAELQAVVDSLAPKSPLRQAQREALDGALRARQTVWLEYVTRVGADDPVVRPATPGTTPASLTRREVEVWRVDPPRVRGFCRLRQEERVFRLERILSVERASSPYAIPRMWGGP